MAGKRIAPLGALAFGLSIALALLPASAQEWQAQLTEQVLRDYDCEVAFLSQVAERMVDGNLVVLATVHCVDQRSFNAYRDDAFEPFEIHPCENPDTRVC
jgi:hypothetical protein